MCDAYSFDATPELMQVSYEKAVSAYLEIFKAVELQVIPVVAQSGAIGGDVNHEFMVPSVIGEDHFASCDSCGYHANTEAAERMANVAVPAPKNAAPLEQHATPGVVTMEDVVSFFQSQGIALTAMVKTIAATTADGEVIVIGVRGDRELRLPHGWELLSDEDLAAHPHLHKGSIGLVGLSSHGIKVAVDAELVATSGPWLTGGNAPNTHTSSVYVGRDLTPDLVGSFVVVEPGDPCPSCGEPLSLIRSVEAAHTFQLGIQYSQKMSGASFLAEDGTEQLLWMGCYGIGVSRLLGVLAEAHHDEQGLRWPAALSPYDLHLVSLGANRNPAIATAAELLYEKLEAQGFTVLYDEREVSPGVKFADADLLGIPTRLLLGGKGLERGVVEWKRRNGGEEGEIALDGPFDLLR